MGTYLSPVKICVACLLRVDMKSMVPWEALGTCQKLGGRLLYVDIMSVKLWESSVTCQS